MGIAIPNDLSRGKREGLFVTLLVLISALLYARSLGFGFVWDDLLYVLGSDAYREFDLAGMLLGLGNGVEYLPVRDLSFAIDFALWGERPVGFHFSNVLIYSATVAVTYLVTRRLIPRLRPGAKPALVEQMALLTAVIFALHPLHVEPVCFVNGRNALISGLFFFLSLLAYLRHMELGSRRWLLASLGFFILAVFSKATAIVLPLLLTLIALTDGKQLKQRLFWLMPFLLAASLAAVLFMLIAESTYVIKPEEAYSLGSLSPWPRMATALQIPPFYLYKFFVPLGLSVDYAPDFASSILSLKVAASLALLVLLTLLAYRFRQRFPEGLFALPAYLVLLLPVMNFFLTSPVVADRYAFLPAYPLAILVAGILVTALRRAMLSVTGLLVCLILGALSLERSKAWESDEILWQATLDNSPRSALAIFNLSNNYLDQGRHDLALQTINRLSAINPYSIIPEAMQARVALIEGEPVRAIELVESAMRDNQPNGEALLVLAQAHEATGRYREALKYYGKILQAQETSLRERKVAEARILAVQPTVLAEFEHELVAVQRNANNPRWLADLAIRLDEAGLDAEALGLYLQLESKHGAHWALSLNIGNIYWQRGEPSLAIEHFKQSIEMKRDNPQALNGLGIALRRLGDYPGAERAFLDAVRVAPEYENAPLNLAILYLRLDRKEEARRYFEYTVERFPELEKQVEAYLARM